MARRKKKSNEKVKAFLKYFIMIVFAVFFLYVIYNRAMYFFCHSPVFSVEEIVKSPSLQFVQSRHLDRLGGRNIFQIDLKGVQRRVQAEYPSVDRLRIVRQLPDRIVVTAERREPFVVVSTGSRDVALDEKGVVLGGDVADRGALPYLSGVTDSSSIQKGRSLSGKRVSVGLAIIRAISENEYLEKFSVNSVDLKNLSMIHVYVNNIEVILDQYNIQKKIETLGLLLSDAGVPIEQVKYLDLRFKEPLINKK